MRRTRTRTGEDDQESFGIFDCELIVRLTAMMMTAMMTVMMTSMMTVMMTTMMTTRKSFDIFDRESIVRPTPPTTYNVQRSSVRRVISEL